MKRNGVTGEVVGSIIGPFVILLAVLAIPLDDREERHLAIHWQRDFSSARALARETGKPILAVTVAGELKGRC